MAWHLTRWSLLGLALCSLPLAAQLPMKTIRVGFYPDIKPWVMADGKDGIAVDILREVLEDEGLRLEVVQLPYARKIQAYRSGNLDGLYGISSQQQQREQLIGSISRGLHSFDNVAVTLSRRKIELDEAADLSRWRVMAWQGASYMLPASYDLLAAVGEGNYLETLDQYQQLSNLLSGRVDVVLTDRLVFESNLKILARDRGQASLPQTSLHAILPPNEAAVLLRDSGLRERLDRRISQLKNSARYGQIFGRYQAEPQP